jgi:Glycosyl transferases group 1
MKLAVFYIRQTFAGWPSLGGYTQAFKRLGHKILDLPLPGNQVRNAELLRGYLPPIDKLNECEAVICFSYEYVQPWLEAVYGFDEWEKVKVPIIGRFDEAIMDRRDLNLPDRMPILLKWASHYSFPAWQDANRFGGQYLPFATDRTMFFPINNSPKLYNVGFIGSMYQPRIDYLEKLAEHVPNDVTFHAGPVIAQDLSGVLEPESTRLLAQNYRSIKVFFCLPALDKLIVTKIFDVMGCGSFVLAPRLPGEAAKNCEIFKADEEIAYYEQGYFAKNAEQIKYWLTHDEERERVARAGCKKVLAEYTLDTMIGCLLLVLGEKAKLACTA